MKNSLISATTKPEIEMLTVRQVAKRGILPERTLRNLIAQGRIPTIKSGRTMYINYSRLCAELQNGAGAIWSE